MSKTNRPKRQAMTITIRQLVNLAKELCEEECWDGCGIDVDHKFQINIINKTPEQSDTWEIE